MNNITALLPHIKLRFNIDHPTLEECYVFGYECAAQEVAEVENPFPQGSKEAEQWLDGWWAGIYGEDPLFTLEHNETIDKTLAVNDKLYVNKHSFLTLVFEISGAIAASALLGYQLFELVA